MTHIYTLALAAFNTFCIPVHAITCSVLESGAAVCTGETAEYGAWSVGIADGGAYTPKQIVPFGENSDLPILTSCTVPSLPHD